MGEEKNPLINMQIRVLVHVKNDLYFPILGV